MTRIPFEISHELADEITGLLYLEDGYLVFEIQVVAWGISKRPVEIVKAELGLIEHVRHQPGILKDSIFIVPKRAQLLEAIPGSHKGELRLKVKKSYRTEAEAFVRALRSKKANVAR